MGAAVPILGLFALFAWLASRRPAAREPIRLPAMRITSKPPSPEVVDAVQNLHQKTPDELELAARSAEASGHTKTAAVLERAADVKREIEREIGTETAAPPVAPFAEATPATWIAYCKALGTRRATWSNADRDHLGMFAAYVRALVDLGYMTNERKVVSPAGNGRTVYTADWKAPYSLAQFFATPRLQLEAFTRQARNARSAILSRHKTTLGTQIDGRAVTLSGLLAVAQRAGLSTLAKWIADPKSRSTENNKIFAAANGLF